VRSSGAHKGRDRAHFSIGSVAQNGVIGAADHSGSSRTAHKGAR